MKRNNKMKTENTLMLVITHNNGVYEVMLTGTGKLDIEVTLTWFDGLEEARAFCDAFEDSRILGTLEDLID